MNPPTTLTNHNPPATIGCGLNPNPIRREESDTPHNPTSKRLETNKPTLQKSQGASVCCQAAWWATVSGQLGCCSSASITRQTRPAILRLRQRMASLWVLPWVIFRS